MLRFVSSSLKMKNYSAIFLKRLSLFSIGNCSYNLEIIIFALCVYHSIHLRITKKDSTLITFNTVSSTCFTIVFFC